jgi:hypothetical protein
MARLKFDGKVREYNPGTGLDFVPGEADYPDDKVEALLATGRFHRARADKPAAAPADEKE